MSHPFQQVDVFATEPFKGNPVAVVFDAQRLSEVRMQAIARWTNLSETTFILPPLHPDADYRLRIFTPGGELAFAGHPTLGSCHAWLHAGGEPEDEAVIVQECGIGLVRIRRTQASPAAALRERLAFAAPPMKQRDVEASLLTAVVRALGLRLEAVHASQWLENGATWLGLRLQSAEQVLALEPDHAALRALPKVGVIGAYPDGSDAAFEVRAFAASAGIPEDPVTGSLNAALAQWLLASDVVHGPYVALQGAKLGRAGRVGISIDAGQVWVEGSCATCVQGVLMSP